jgi:hypothetical protein
MLAAMLPDRDYLALIGELAYRVSYLEWLVLGDLGNALPRPTGIDVPSLMGKSTGQIAGAVAQAARGWGEELELLRFGELAAEALGDVSQRRNHVLHARPATTEVGKQMLLRDRWKGNGQRENFWITPEYLREQIAAVEDWTSRLQAIRLLRE